MVPVLLASTMDISVTEIPVCGKNVTVKGRCLVQQTQCIVGAMESC
jgi:hypothetical protein